MSQLLIRNLESNIVNHLKNMAKLHHRSLQGEIKFILERVTVIPPNKLSLLLGEPIQTAWPADFFEKIAGGWQGDELIRAPQGSFEKREDFE